jgi:hypothetical protein
MQCYYILLAGGIMDFVRLAIEERRDDLIASWQPFVDSIDHYMELDGFDPLTQEEAGTMCEELEWELKQGKMEHWGLVMPSICSKHGMAAVCRQQIERLKKEE